MKKLRVLVMMIVACLRPVYAAPPESPSAAAGRALMGPFTEAELKQFVALDVIDSHTHIFKPSPLFTRMTARLNLHMIDILVMDDHGKKLVTLSQLRSRAKSVIDTDPGRVKLCTTFDPYKIGTPDFAAHAVNELNQDFTDGAIAVKIWKNVGMEIKNADGRYILPDDPALEPIYKDIADRNKTLIAHVADPNTLWAPPNPKADDYDYYMYEEPWWYMYNKPGMNSKAEILRARDHIMEINPTLRVVGAHLGSMEADFKDLGAHFDKYPNFAVDLAGRVPYFEMMPRDEAIAFITKYQDRLIYGTDNDHEFYPAGKARETERFWESAYAIQWRYFATSDVVTYQGRKVQGLNLPMPILRKLYRENALKWFPGVVDSE